MTAKPAPVVYVAIMRRKHSKRRHAVGLSDSREVTRDAGLWHQRAGPKLVYLGTRAVPLEPDEEGTP